MKKKIKQWMRPGLFALGGVLAGLGCYYFVGCASGSCPITSNPISSMAYMGAVGWLLSGIFGKGCESGCSM